MTNKRRKAWIIIAVAAALLSVAFLASARLIPESPLHDVEKARESLSEAWKNNAEKYSGKLYREAKANYDSAMANWKLENEKFLFFRNYDRVKMFAGLCSEKAVLAIESSKDNTASLRNRIVVRIDTLESLVTEINRIFSSYPLESEIRNRISRGRILLKESELAFTKGEYLESFRKVTDAEYMIMSSYETASGQLRSYFSSYGKWKNWVDKTIRDSRRTGGYAIIIDKFHHRLHVYQKGVKKMEYAAELGRNWVGDKRFRGDNATPEGMYKVTRKLDRGNTKYHRALLLDYPNAEDLESFRSEVKKGTLLQDAKPGGLIEIHGNGGRSTDWTEGCVALTDTEMDAVFKIAAIGTPVTIVGSMTDLPSLLNQ